MILMYVAMKQVHVPTPVLDYPTVHHADVPYNTHPVSGPWGSAMDVIMCLLPIIFLVIATIPPCGLKPLSTTKSLPMSALLMFLVRLMYLGSDPLLVSGSIVKGIHEAFTPLSIMVRTGFFIDVYLCTGLSSCQVAFHVSGWCYMFIRNDGEYTLLAIYDEGNESFNGWTSRG